MLEITYTTLLVGITAIWILVRAGCGIKARKADWKHETKLLTVYICLVVIARFVYFPLALVDGHIAALEFDANKMFPLWVNLLPIVPLCEQYDGWLINIIGNVAMFIPVGMAWPFCFKKLNTAGKALLAGGGLSFFIEITQLPFYGRCSDINDLLLNTTGVLIGALLFFGIQRAVKAKR